jgi:hypothetical protein
MVEWMSVRSSFDLSVTSILTESFSGILAGSEYFLAS